LRVEVIGLGTGIVKKHLLIAPVHAFTNFVRGTCTGTRLNQLWFDQSEIALEAGRTGTRLNQLWFDQSEIAFEAGRAKDWALPGVLPDMTEALRPYPPMAPGGLLPPPPL